MSNLEMSNLEWMLHRHGEILEVADIQEILNIGRTQAYDLVHSRAFNHVRVGKSIKVPTADFVRWLHGESAVEVE